MGSPPSISRRTFGRAWKRMKDARPALQRSHLSTAHALQALLDAGLLTAVDAAAHDGRSVIDTLYLVGWGGTQADLDPLEILTALGPPGTVSYFSAFALHGLTTQVPTQHRVATLVERRLPVDVVSANVSGSTHQRLGTLRALIDNVPYYSTQRTAQLVVGIQRRTVAPWLVVRCTSVAQTVIDGILRAYCCGGPSVVVEAWERAAEVTTAEALIDLASAIGYGPVARRVGYMIATVAGFRGTVDPARLERLYPAGQDVTPIPIFPGFPPGVLNDRWHVLGL